MPLNTYIQLIHNVMYTLTT
eukprot:UN16200